jgi:nicotinate phosphoribosyltransferase
MRLLDTDLYKFTQQQAIMQHYPWAEAEYELIVRAPVIWPERFERLFTNIDRELAGVLPLTAAEQGELRDDLPFLTRPYREFLAGYRFDMNEIVECGCSTAVGGPLRLSVRGPWYRTVLWEVPLMALISGLYHEACGEVELRPIAERAHAKARQLAEARIQVVEGGTRRRYGPGVQRIVLDVLEEHNVLAGTSNVGLALECGIPCVGTVAHEWFMFHGACFGYRGANRLALQRWVDTYQGQLGVALADTYTTEAFLAEFDPVLARVYDGVRQDSGNPITVADRVIAHYEDLGIDPRSKFIVFSDGLNAKRAAAIQRFVQGRIGARFLIGTDLTCDVPGVTPLNMVIKMTRCRLSPRDPWRATVKLSDVPGKHLGPEKEIERCKMDLGIE